VYNRAAVILLQAERINWDKPPRWAAAPADTAAPSTEQKSPAEPVPTKPPVKKPHTAFGPGFSPHRKNWVTSW
jgi:phage terminase large subunit GpA-like protein